MHRRLLIMQPIGWIKCTINIANVMKQPHLLEYTD